MPNEKTYEKMNIFEDIFNKEIESQGFCFLLTSITGGGKKIWQIYSTDIDLFIQKLNEVMANIEILPLEIEFFEDEDWNGYKEIISWTE